MFAINIYLHNKKELFCYSVKLTDQLIKNSFVKKLYRHTGGKQGVPWKQVRSDNSQKKSEGKKNPGRYVTLEYTADNLNIDVD